MNDAEERDNRRAGEEELPSTASFTGSEKGPGGQIGSYKLLGILGEGGFAVVYLAERQKPVRRRVALKVIKPGMDSKQVIARFEAERQALALLDHPNIAQVFDAGTTEAGRPYFVMECVKGVSLTKHCDREKLGIEERLGLFLQVCEGVQHAHQKGIIHRDIKPSNILVSIEGEKAVPKIIDFGVAKAITQPLTERTLYTEQGQLIGTPEYMSPEQAEMTAQDVDTRSDIYSLGVLLYELLTGTLPFDRKTLEQAGFAEIQRIIREEDPPRPSTRLSSLGEEATKVAKSRRTEVAALAKRLHKELEWIPLKAMRKERTHRYRSASELGDDIQNYLNGAPLIAGPESVLYRVKKFVRRNRALITGIAAVLVVLIAGIVVCTIFAIGQARARTDADYQRQVAEAERDRAVEAERLAEQGRAEAVRARMAEAEQRQIAETERDRARAAEQLAEQRLAEATMARRAETEQRQVAESERDRSLEAERLAEQRRVESAAARDEAKQQAKILEATNAFLTNNLLASVDPARAKDQEVTVREALDTASENIEEKLEGEPLVEGAIRKALGNVYMSLGEYKVAEPHLERARENYRKQLGEEHPDTLNSMSNLALLYYKQGRYDEAKLLQVKTLGIRRRVLGEEHLDTLISMNNLALLYYKQGRYDEAGPLHVKALEIRRRVLGEKHPSTLESMYNLAVLYRDQGRYDEAEPLFVEMLEVRRLVLGEEHPSTLLSMHNLADLYYKHGRYDKASPLLAEVLEIRRRTLGKERASPLDFVGGLAKAITDAVRLTAEGLLKLTGK